MSDRILLVGDALPDAESDPSGLLDALIEDNADSCAVTMIDVLLITDAALLAELVESEGTLENEDVGVVDAATDAASLKLPLPDIVVLGMLTADTDELAVNEFDFDKLVDLLVDLDTDRDGVMDAAALTRPDVEEVTKTAATDLEGDTVISELIDLDFDSDLVRVTLATADTLTGASETDAVPDTDTLGTTCSTLELPISLYS